MSPAPAAGSERATSHARRPTATLLLGGTNDNAIAPVLYKSLDYIRRRILCRYRRWRRLQRDRRQSGGAGAYARGAGELHQGQSRQAHVGRHARHRAASDARIHPGAYRRRHGVRALQRCRAGHRRRFGQPHSGQRQRQVGAVAADQGRQAARARGVERRALAGTARRADVARAGSMVSRPRSGSC